MTISINTLISIKDNVISENITEGSLAGLILTDNPLISPNIGSNVKTFFSLDAVTAFFGISSAEYNAAAIYFKGFRGSTKTPDFILFGRYSSTANPGIIISGVVTGTLANFKAITAGTLSLTMGGNNVNLTAIDLSSATSISNVATLLQTKLQANAGTSTATVQYSSISNKFTINTTLSGATQTISFATSTPLSLLLKLTATDGGSLSQGTAALTPAQNMENILSTTANWFSFTTLFSTDTDYDTAKALAAWTSSKGTLYAYYPWTLDVNTYDPTSTTDLASLLAPFKYSCVSVTYGPLDKSIFAMSIRASINYNVTNATASDAWKSQEGLTADVTDSAIAAVLITKKVNYYGNYSTKAEKFDIYFQGAVVGEYLYIDNYANQVWLADRLSVTLANLFRIAVRIPNNDTGNQQINASIEEVITKAKVNGVVQIGNTFSSSIRALLTQQAALDITSQLTNQGYYIKIVPASEDDRAARKGATFILWYTNGQAVHSLPIITNLVI